DSGPQYNYSLPGLAVDPFRKDELCTRKGQALASLFAVDHPEARALAAHALREADPLTFYMLASSLRVHCKTRADYDELLAEARERQGELVDVMQAVMAERMRPPHLLHLPP